MNDRPSNFEEFWPLYVAEHLDPTCRKLHFAGTSLALAFIAFSPFYRSGLLLAPLFGYGLAWVGHFWFEGNKPASWASPKHALWSLQGDLRMWYLMLTGRMVAEIDRVLDPPTSRMN